MWIGALSNYWSAWGVPLEKQAVFKWGEESEVLPLGKEQKACCC